MFCRLVSKCSWHQIGLEVAKGLFLRRRILGQVKAHVAGLWIEQRIDAHLGDVCPRNGRDLLVVCLVPELARGGCRFFVVAGDPDDAVALGREEEGEV